MFQLLSKSGPHKGTIWTVDDEPVVIGRDANCDVHVQDGLVSRRHCQVERNDNRLLLIDLGSRNCTLVNGRPAASCELKPGDELSVGSERFVVLAADAKEPAETKFFQPQSTISLGHIEAFAIQPDTADARSQTVSDLADLFALSQEMWTVSNADQVMRRLAVWLSGRYELHLAWTFRADEGGKFTRPVTLSGAPAERDIQAVQPFVDKARESQLVLWGLLESDDKRAFVCAPMSVGPRMAGILTIVGANDGKPFDDHDAQVASAAAHIVAPSLLAMEQIESLGLENEQLRRARPEKPLLIGKSRAIAQLRAAVRKAAPSDLSVLIEGETGSGKEVVARLIHDLSDRHDQAFVAVNCAAIPRDLFESELFGHEKGAFTGAVRTKPGLIEIAHGGTLFLDEVGDLSADNQARLLRVLETRQYRRVGGGQELAADFRVVAATNKILIQEIRAGAFRHDLYYRLSGITLRTPPLRDRPSDIPDLAEHFLDRARANSRLPIAGFAPETLNELCARRWNGNVRELRAAIERAVAVTTGPYIAVEDIQAGSGAPGGEAPGPLEDLEKQHIERVLEYTGWRISETARILKIGRTTLYEKLARYGLRTPGKPTRPISG